MRTSDLERRTVLQGPWARPSPCPGWRRWPRPPASPPAAAARTRRPRDGLPLRPQRRAHAGLDARRGPAPTSSCRASSSRLAAQERPARPHRPGPAQRPAPSATAPATTPGRWPASSPASTRSRPTAPTSTPASPSTRSPRQKIGCHTRFPSLELGIEPGAQSGNCDSGYSCAYSSNISWRSPTQPWPRRSTPGWSSSGSSATTDPSELDRPPTPLQQEHPRLRRRRRPAPPRPPRRQRPPQGRRVPDLRPRDRTPR